MVQILDRTELPESPTAEPTERRSSRSVLTWAGVACALAVAIVLAALVLFDGSGSTARGVVFTEHGRLHAVENSINGTQAGVDATRNEVFTQHGLLHSVEDSTDDGDVGDDVAPSEAFTEHGLLHGNG